MTTRRAKSARILGARLRWIPRTARRAWSALADEAEEEGWIPPVVGGLFVVVGLVWTVTLIWPR